MQKGRMQRQKGNRQQATGNRQQATGKDNKQRLQTKGRLGVLEKVVTVSKESISDENVSRGCPSSPSSFSSTRGCMETPCASFGSCLLIASAAAFTSSSALSADMECFVRVLQICLASTKVRRDFP